MPYCQKCGSQVEESMTFCPKCGASLKAEQPRTIEGQAKEFGERMGRWGEDVGQRMSGEKTEKREKGEKGEKKEKGGEPEKHEKGEYGFIGPLIGGLILIFIGLMSYLQITGYLEGKVFGAAFLILIGVIVIVGAVLAFRRHPKT